MWRGAAHTTLVLARKVSETSAWSDYISNEVEGGMQTYYGPAASGL
jgi:hypothetical protein